MSVLLEIKQQFVERPLKGEYAQNKAHDDVAAVLDQMGFERIEISRRIPRGVLSNNWERIKWLLCCPFWRRKIKSNATVFVQYTITSWFGSLAFHLLNEKVKAKKHLRIIALVHDINRTDVGFDCLTAHELRFFSLCDKILLHTEAMRIFFIRHGVDADKLVIFETFDYFTDEPMNPLTAEKMNTVNVCGNLDPSKCGCYKDLCTIRGVEWKLYGPNYSPTYAAENVEWAGCFSPEQLPGRLKYGFGLIWDGDLSDTQSGLFGLYQKINHPHKLALYLSSGLPVLVSEGSGIAKFVTRNQVGLTIASLHDIPERVTSIDKQAYEVLRRNAVTLGKCLRSGFFIREVVEHACGKKERKAYAYS